MKPRRHNPEHAFHVSVAGYLSVALPPETFFTTFPAGGGGRVRGAKLKAAGLRSGVPDVWILWRGRSILIELKDPQGGALSAAQKETHSAITLAGGVVLPEARSLDEIAAFLKVLGIPLRARLQDGKLYSADPEAPQITIKTGRTARVYVPKTRKPSQRAFEAARDFFKP